MSLSITMSRSDTVFFTEEAAMKKIAVMLIALGAIAAASTARAGGVGIGVFGGSAIPLIQEDNGQGTVWGLRVPLTLVPMLTLEPYYAKTSGGDKDQTVDGITYTRSGIDLSNAMLTFGTGFQMYPYAGIGSASAERSGLKQTSTAYNFGLGFGFKPPVVGLSVHLRGEVQAVLDEDNSDTARKWANATLGVSYDFFGVPGTP
jgi:hypothetical protein